MIRHLALAFVTMASAALCSCAGSPGAAPAGALPGTLLQQSATLRAPAGLPAESVSITEFQAGLHDGHALGYITNGPDGAMWFTEYIDPDFGAQLVSRITADGTVKQYAFSPPVSQFPALSGIATGSDHALWVTDSGDGAIARFSVEGKQTTYVLTSKGGLSKPSGITAGPDGALWFADAGLNRIGRITTSGSVTYFTQGISPQASPDRIATGSDGALWFTELYLSRIGRITTSGVVTEFARGISAKATLSSITSGPDGALWFTEQGSINAVGRISTAGVVHEFTQGIAPGESPTSITAGADGALWFVEHGSMANVGRITTNGTISLYSTGLNQKSFPFAIARGPGNTVWFTQLDHHIGRVTF